jgi:sulfur carrier protein
MVVYCNNIEHSVPASASITGVLDALGINAGRGTAVAVNNTVIPRSAWSEHILADNDRLTVIRATQGG